MHLSGLEKQWEWFKLRGGAEGHYPSHPPACDYKGTSRWQPRGTAVSRSLECTLGSSACLLTSWLSLFLCTLLSWSKNHPRESHVVCECMSCTGLLDTRQLWFCLRSLGICSLPFSEYKDLPSQKVVPSERSAQLIPQHLMGKRGKHQSLLLPCLGNESQFFIIKPCDFEL